MSHAHPPPCAGCEGGCCSFFELRVTFTDLDPGVRYDSHLMEMGEDGNLDQLLMEDGSVPDMRWFIWDNPLDDDRRSLVFDCGHVSDNGLCTVYDERPSMCRTFQCAALKDEEGLDEFLGRVAWYEDDGYYDERPTPGHPHLTEVTERVHELIERYA